MCKTIPTALLAPIINEYLASQGEATEGRFGQEADETPDLTFNPAALLATRAGVSEDTLYKIRRCKTSKVYFDIADRLMSAMELNHLWYEGYLYEVYMNVDLRVAADVNPDWRCVNGCDPSEGRIWGGIIVCAVCQRENDRRWKEKVQYSGRRAAA